MTIAVAAIGSALGAPFGLCPVRLPLLDVLRLRRGEERGYNGAPGRVLLRAVALEAAGGAREIDLRGAGPIGRLPMPSDDSDKALVERVKAGDVRAFEVIHRRYYARIYRFAFLKLGNAEDAADVASTTFCRALRSLPSYQFRRTPSLYPWLHQIAGNLVVDVVRTRPAGGMLSLDAQAAEDVDSFLEYLADAGLNPQELVERAEVQELVREAIEKLPADQARAVVLRFLADLPIRDIARALDRTEGAVKSLLHRALQGLRRHLKQTIAAAREQGPVTAHSRGTGGIHGSEVVHLRRGDS